MYCDGYGDHRDLHVLTHSFPTRRSADLTGHADGAALVVPFARLRGRPDLLRPFERDDQYVVAVDDDGDIVHAEDRHALAAGADEVRSEEHTSELQSLMRISYAVCCLKKKNTPS